MSDIKWLFASDVHGFVAATPQATYCDRKNCRKHYSEPIHHQRGYVCPNGLPCMVCGKVEKG